LIKLQGKLPRDIYLAVSGGVDSMAALDFLRRNHNVCVLHYHHGTLHAKEANKFVMEYCRTNDIDVLPGSLRIGVPLPTTNKEEFWRNARYDFLDQFTDKPVITCHHLDDCVETWLWSSMHGEGKLIPYKRENYIRPFRLTRKRDLTLWADLNNVPYVEDDSNNDLRYTRNYIRHKIMPNVLQVNPGIHKTIGKKLRKDIK
jgi:tRNA(Ile)-lysidine synthase